jgi:hypothetical protein
MLVHPPVLLTGVAAILATETLASVAARWLGFKYKYSMVASVAIYAAVGWFTAKAAPAASPALAAALIGVTESTLGWGISWGLGPGRPSTMKHIKAQVVLAVLGGAALAAAVGAAAGWLARRA